MKTVPSPGPRLFVACTVCGHRFEVRTCPDAAQGCGAVHLLGLARHAPACWLLRAGWPREVPR